MNKNLVNLIFLIVGILFGIIFSSGLKYPFEIKDVDKARLVCKEIPVKKIKIGITGKIFEVECSNDTIYKLD